VQGLLQLPLLAALDGSGGRARPRDLYAGLAEGLGLDPSVRDERRACADGQSYAVFDQQVRWARQTAVAQGLVAGDRGVWELTAAGEARLGRVRRGSAVLLYRVDDGVALWAHAEDAAGVVEPGSVSLIMVSPPYPVVNRDYGRFGVAAWLDMMSELVGLWRGLLRPDGTLAVNLGDVHVPGAPTISTHVERFTLDAVDRHGYHLAGRTAWYSPSKLPNLEWSVKRRVVPRNALEHVVMLTPSANPAWDVRRLPLEGYAERGAAASARDALRTGRSRRPGGYEVREEAFARGEGRIPANLVVSGGAGGGGRYAARCRAAGLPVHPARFPEAVPRHVILLATDVGQVVMDPMAGSGVTAKVASETGRRWVTSEPMLGYARGSALRFDERPDFVDSSGLVRRGA
jgi:site-specific DNA-methyltransferase (cytosine-N4-specific)